MYARVAEFGMLFCLLRKNDAMLIGGNMTLDQTGAVNIYSTLFRNGRALDGGGVALHDADVGPFFYSCEFRDNKASRGGAVFINSQGVGGTYGNCTVASNDALANVGAIPPLPGVGGGFYVDMLGGGAMTIYNSIVYFNLEFTGGVSAAGSSIKGPDAGAVAVTYSDVEIVIFPVPPPPLIAWPGTGNILADPLFVSVATDDYNLQSTSPCLDAGHDPTAPPLLGIPLDVLDLDDSPASTITPFDLVKGNRREIPDPLNPPASDTGVDGAVVIPGINDMGCHER